MYRRRRYGADIVDVARVIWESLDYVCAGRLTPVLLEPGFAKTISVLSMRYTSEKSTV